MHNQAEKSTFNMWFGDLPKNWSYQKINLLFSERKTKVSDKDYLPLSVAKIGVVPQLDTAVKTDAGDNRKLVRSGDFVINSRSDRKGSCGISNFDGSVSLINIVLTPREELNRNFIHYLMRSNPFSEEFYRYGRGIVGDLWTTRYSEMKNIFLPIPPRDEQDQIVRFLDWKVSAINRLINIKKKEIKEIEALKKSLIDDCVTHGLSPDVPMKDSGVKWLGQIPAHWKTIKIKYLFKERVDKGHPNKPMLVASQNMGVVPKYVYGSRTVEAMKDLQLLKLVKVGDFVISLRSFQGGIERAYYEGIISPAYTIMIPGHQIESGYFRYLAKSVSFIELLKLCVTGIREGQNIDYNKLKNNLLLVPPLNEQALISKFLDSKLKNYDNIRIYLQKQIGSLNELKSRLISDAVTGQIDVRDVEIPSFDMVEEVIEEEKLENNDETEENGEVE